MWKNSCCDFKTCLGKNNAFVGMNVSDPKLNVEYFLFHFFVVVDFVYLFDPSCSFSQSIFSFFDPLSPSRFGSMVISCFNKHSRDCQSQVENCWLPHLYPMSLYISSSYSQLEKKLCILPFHTIKTQWVWVSVVGCWFGILLICILLIPSVFSKSLRSL